VSLKVFLELKNPWHFRQISLTVIQLMGNTRNGLEYYSYAMLGLELCMTSYDLGLRGPSRRAALCSAGPRPIQETGAEMSTPTGLLMQGLKAPS